MSKHDRWFFTTIAITILLQAIHLVLRSMYFRRYGVLYTGPDFGLLINLGMLVSLSACLLVYRGKND